MLEPQPAGVNAVTRATIELLSEGGHRAATVDAITCRSGCAKTAIYRRWPSRDALVLEAFRVAVQGTDEHIAEVAAHGRELGSTVRGSARNILRLVHSPVFRTAFRPSRASS